VALTVTVDTTKNPAEATVVSDRREVVFTATTAGETVTATGRYPIKITDDSRTWKPKTGPDGKPIDDGKTAVFVVA